MQICLSTSEVRSSRIIALSILEIDPDYQDAKLNLNRVRFKITATETSASNALDSSSVTASAVGGLSRRSSFVSFC